MSSTPQDAGEIARATVVDWMTAIYPHQPLGAHIKSLTDITAAAIEADRQAERDRHAAEDQRRRWRVLGDAAKSMCEACRTGVKVIMLDDQIFHDVPDGIDGCDAAPIQLMIFAEMIAAQEATNSTPQILIPIANPYVYHLLRPGTEFSLCGRASTTSKAQYKIVAKCDARRGLCRHCFRVRQKEAANVA